MHATLAGHKLVLQADQDQDAWTVDCSAEDFTVSKSGPPGLPDTDTLYLELVTTARRHVLRCESAAERDAWCSAIEDGPAEPAPLAPPAEAAAMPQTPDADRDVIGELLCDDHAGRLNEDLSVLRVFFVNSKGGAAGLRAVCGVASSLLLINLLQLAER